METKLYSDAPQDIKVPVKSPLDVRLTEDIHALKAPA